MFGFENLVSYFYPTVPNIYILLMFNNCLLNELISMTEVSFFGQIMSSFVYRDLQRELGNVSEQTG